MPGALNRKYIIGKGVYIPEMYGKTVLTNTNYTALETDFIILVDTSGGTVDIDLTGSAVIEGKILTIKDYSGTSDINNITFTGTIDGSAAYVINKIFGAITIISYSDWFIISAT